MTDPRETLCDLGYEDSIILTDFDEAIIGVSTEGEVIYSFDKMIELLHDKYDMSWEEAIEDIDYNTVRSLPYMPYPRPVIMREI